MAFEKTVANAAIENRATDTDGAANGVPANAGAGRPSGAAGDVWDALTANPGGTVATIAAASQVSRATVTRTLTTLETDGRAVRTRGGRDGGKRLPDVWRAAVPTTGTTTDADTTTATTGDAATAAPSGDADTTADGDTGPQDTPPAVPDTDRPADGATDAGTADGDEPGMDAAAVAEARAALTALGAAITDALTGLDGGDGAAALAAVETVYGGSGKARRLVRAAATGRPRNASGLPRSQPGEMRAKVIAHLTAHRGAEFTPHEVAKVIGHSAGAVSNALDRLVEKGHAELVCERPRRFTAVPAAEAAPPATTAAH